MSTSLYEGDVDWTEIDRLIDRDGSGGETPKAFTAQHVIEALYDRGHLAFPYETSARMRSRAMAAELAVIAAFGEEVPE